VYLLLLFGNFLTFHHAASELFVQEFNYGSNLPDSIGHFNHSATCQSEAFPQHGSMDEEVENLPTGMQFELALNVEPKFAPNLGFDDDHHPDDFIKTEYHPVSGRAPVVIALAEYRSQASNPVDDHHVMEDTPPYAPFKTIGDFRFARIAIQNNLTNDTVDALLGVYHLNKESPVTFRNHRDMRKVLDEASTLLTGVCSTIS
jgi:hypothetical protein